ncbi:uncharacterized protein LOC127249397 isoform X2 [Andrographis paniculata]|uniref:uncharacterized protein LOC127249397 isoform X2 n=1 Tax=Andrographis paniculata TaxID=175694 RepID=UPI0021E7DD65|nr:uncharacterized protein LOC127249397 isoform X2 [Andrographis paniculata]
MELRPTLATEINDISLASAFAAPDPTTMELCCDICGNIGVKEAIIFCSQCKINCEHMYCMKTPLMERVDWICEDCESRSQVLSEASSEQLPSVSKLSNTLDVPNDKAKSVEKKGSLDLQRKKVSFALGKVKPGKTKYICPEEAILLSSGASNSILNSKGASRSRPNEKLKTLRFDNPGTFKGKKVDKLSGGNGGNSIELRTSNTGNLDKNLLPDDNAHAYTPSLGAAWLGRFNIHNFRNRELILHVRAHCPSRVRKMVYEFSRKMPAVLDFELVSCKKFWVYFFQGYFPDIRDIGLYFFSREVERCVSLFCSGAVH